MDIMRDLLASDAARPRLTVYDETQGARLEFSATTLSNWASKVASLLRQETLTDIPPAHYPTHEESPFGSVAILLPAGWQTVAISLGALVIGAAISVKELGPFDPPDIVACPVDKAKPYIDIDEDEYEPDSAWVVNPPDVYLVTEDPFGRGVKELDNTPHGFEGMAIDFGPSVRVCDDHYGDPCSSLIEAVSNLTGRKIMPAEHHQRLLVHDWQNTQEYIDHVLVPLAQGHTVVVVRGLVSQQRLEHIKKEERVSLQLRTSGIQGIKA